MMRWGTSRNLWLFTIKEYNMLPDGFILETINPGEIVTKGPNLDMDTRFGYLAYGVCNPLTHPESELLAKIRLSI